MKYSGPFFALACAGIMLTGGCGTSSATQKVSTLFGKDKDASAEAAPAEKPAASVPASPADDKAFMEGSLEQQLQVLRKQLQDEQAKIRESNAKVDEYSQRSREYSARLELTQQRIARLEKVINAIEHDGGTFFNEQDKSKPAAAAPASSPSLPDSNLDSLFTGGPDLEPPRLSGKNQTRIESDAFTASGDSWVASADVKAPGAPAAAQGNPVFAPPAAPVRDGFSTHVLASEGEGQQGVIILASGQKQNVKEGAYFSIPTRTGEEVIVVVTDVYPTCSRAVPHPKYGQGKVNLEDKAFLLNSLPK